MRNIQGSHGGVLSFHRRAHAQLSLAFAEIESQGLLHHIRSCAGTLNQRLSKPTSGGLSKIPSGHAFGIAIDLNSDDGNNGATAAPVAPTFKRHGFRWGEEFSSPDPMHFEVAQFLEVGRLMDASVAFDLPFIACRQRVLNRGTPPVGFLQELVAWGRQADEAIFEPNSTFDIYSAIAPQLGPWQGPQHRRAAMLEALRVLGGFESSWKRNEGRDPNNPNHSLCAEEAGIFQCSGDSMGLDPSLRQLLIKASGSDTCASFIETTKADHQCALEYCARLLRITTKHHGPVRFGHINDWLRRDAVEEFRRFIG